MNVATNRLKSFTQHEPPWPYLNDSLYHAPEEFANAGFYNVSTRRNTDKVQCYLCNISLADWNQGQSPLGRHAHAAKTCPLVLLNFPDALTTIPIVEQDTNTYPESDFMTKTRLKTFTKNRAWPPPLTTTDNAQQQQQQQQQQSPTTGTRQSTKQRLHPTAPKLADAGFVFLPTLNEPDRVKCPYCQFCLSNFNSAASPWIQHQKARPTCLYVTRKRASLLTKRSSLPQKRNIPTGPSSALKKTRRATTNSYDKENAAKAVAGDDDHNSLTSATENNNNDTGDKSRFDDSIWDIAKAQMQYKPHPDLATTANRQRPSNAKQLVTYEKKKHKRPSKVLPPELTKPTAPSSSSTKSSESATRTKKQHQPAVASSSQQQKQTTTSAVTAPATTSNQQQQKDAEETPAQVLARLQKTPINGSTSKDKGKGRASDSTTKKITKDSLRLSTSKKTAPETSSSSSRARSSDNLTPSSSKTATLTESALPSLSVAATTTTTTVASSSTHLMISEPEQQRYSFMASTPSSSGRRSKLQASTPIHSRIDHGNDLMALTFSPIRGAGNAMMTAGAGGVSGAFGSLETPRTGRTMATELDIGAQIEQRFRANKRRLTSSTRSIQQSKTTTKPSDHHYYSGPPILDFDSSDNDDENDDKPTTTTEVAATLPGKLTEEQLTLTVEGFIKSLVEHQVARVKEHGEQLIKSIQEEVADSKKSILANNSMG